MDNYKEVLEYMIELKKTKKEPNRIERDQFAEAWQNLVATEGYSQDADAFFYNGFTYCGAAIVMHYVKKSDNPVEAIRMVFSGNMYGKNCAITVSVLFHLLALLLNEKKPNLLLISEVIKRIPSALKNKEGKKYGQADRVLKKYILDVLRSEALPSMGELLDSGLQAVFVKEFILSFDEIISGMKTDGYSKRSLRNIEIINAWMHPAEKEIASSEDASASETETKAGNEAPVENVETSEASESEEKVEIEVHSPLLDCERRIAELTGQLKETSKELEKLKKVNATLKQRLSDDTEDKIRMAEAAEARQLKINSLSEELASSKKRIEMLLQRIEQLERELQERMKMMEALSRDRAKQSDEAFNRLASKLRIEYKDFMDAVDIPMDSDLGENMREQLKNVFSILIKSGIVIN